MADRVQIIAEVSATFLLTTLHCPSCGDKGSVWQRADMLAIMGCTTCNEHFAINTSPEGPEVESFDLRAIARKVRHG